MNTSLNKRNIASDLLLILPAFLFILSVTIVRLHLFSMPMTDVYWSEAMDESTLSDLFNYWKAVTIIIASCLAIVIFVVAYLKDFVFVKKSFFYIPALIYAAFVLISYAFSDYKYFALRGMSEHFEGTIILLSYIVIVFFLANMVDSKRRLKCVVYCALGAAFLLGILGITQATGHDFFSTAIGQKLMTPNYVLDTGIKSWDMIDILAASGQRVYDFSFTEGEVYQTVYNINYVPLYLSLVVPLIAFLFLFTANKTYNKKLFEVVEIFLFGVVLYNYFAANAASGYLGLIVVFIGLFVISLKYIKKWIKPIVCLIVMLGLIMGITADRWLPEVVSILGNIRQEVTEYIYADDLPSIRYDFENAPGMTTPHFDYIESVDNHLDFSINGNIFRITRDIANSGYEISDGDNNSLFITTIENDPGWYQILDERFHDYIKVSLEERDGVTYFVVYTRGTYWPFRYNGDSFVMQNVVGKEAPLRRIPHSSLIKNYSFGTNRGLIWDTTIPLLKYYLIKGSGADTFVFAYPQNDYATISNHYGSYMRNLVTDKAHNLYLQYWVNTGLISLLAWLTMVGYYLVGAVKQFRKRGFVDFCDFVNGGIFCGILGFLAVAFFNDGSVNTMPMFYTMLGTGLAINMRDKWPGEEASTGSAAGDGPSTGSGPVDGKKGKKAKAAAEVMPEM